jgi:hypothetical protein
MRQPRATDSRHPRRRGNELPLFDPCPLDVRRARRDLPHFDVVPVMDVLLRLIHAINTSRSVHKKLDVPYPSFEFVVGTTF